MSAFVCKTEVKNNYMQHSLPAIFMLSTAVKTGRIKVKDNIEKQNSLKKTSNTDSSQSSLKELGTNVSQFIASRFYTRIYCLRR